MKIQNLFAMFLILLCFAGYGQNVSTGEVMAVIPLGGQSYSVIHEDGTENYYKTSPHPSNTLFQGQPIELQFNSSGTPSTIQVIAVNLSDALFCQQITPSIENNGLMPLLRGIDMGYRRHVGYNSEHNVLVFQTWNDVRSLELLIEESVRNYPYNQGNEEAIFDIMNLIRLNGWNMSPNQTGNNVSLPLFKEFLNNSYPLSSNVLIALIELDEEEGLNPVFMSDVFTSNLPLSYNTEQRLMSSTMAPGIKNQILDANDNFLDAPNHAYLDFIATFPGYYSLYEKLNSDERTKLESGMDPADPLFDTDPVIIPFERLIMNDKHEVWIEGHLYKLYENCRAISMQESVANAYEDLAVLNPDGSPNIPQLNEGPQGLSQQVMDGYVPSGYMVYNPQEFDPLGNINDDPNYNTALQTYNFITGCPVSNYTYSLYTTSDLSVDFYNMTDFSDVIQPENTFYHYWTFGDGTGSFQNNPSHTYSNFGTYTVRLTTFNADCGCWHVHTYQIVVQEPQLREGNPDCPIESVVPWTIGQDLDELEVRIVASSGSPVTPGTFVSNYIFDINKADGTPVALIENGTNHELYYTLPEAGTYTVTVFLIWSDGCESVGDPHAFTVTSTPEDPECCDKKDRESNEPFLVTYNNDQYKLKVKDIARGSFGTVSWRKIQGTHELYVKKQNKILWKKQPAWHDIEVNAEYYERYFILSEGSVCVEEITQQGSVTISAPFTFYTYGRNCGSESYNEQTGTGTFLEKFGLFENSVQITHKVYLGGSMTSIPPTPGNCCDCYNTGGHLLFDLTIQLGECE